MSERITPELVLHAYREGLFPMADARGRIAWYSPDPRGIFEIERFRPSRSLRQQIRRRAFEVRVNTAFGQVIDACASAHGATWISPTIRRLYAALHESGYAHSVESWQSDELAGGLYGVAIGGAFFGESMFHRATDASKVALAALIERLRARGFALLDTQWITPHLQSLGAVEIPRAEYLRRLRAALELDCQFV
jgi:leucyl/phenylalanyl-tRNA--protein transferase